MKAQPEMKWLLVKAGVLAAFGLAVIVLALALPTAPAEAPVVAEASPHAKDGAPVEPD